jgi:hypothetical protein
MGTRTSSSSFRLFAHCHHHHHHQQHLFASPRLIKSVLPKPAYLSRRKADHQACTSRSRREPVQRQNPGLIPFQRLSK